MSFTFERTPIAKEPISFVIPVGPGQQIEGMVAEIHVQLGDHEHELNAIPYGSATLAINESGVQVMPSAASYGPALVAGINAARHPLLFIWPAAWRRCVPNLKEFLQAIDDADVVAGYRPRRSRMSRFRDNWLTALSFGPYVQDLRCPVRLYRKSILERIPIQSTGTFADVELLVKANYLNGLLDEVELPASVEVENDVAWGTDFRRLLRKPEFLAAKG